MHKIYENTQKKHPKFIASVWFESYSTCKI